MKALKEILNVDENKDQMVFENIDDHLEIAKSLVAFSNSDGGLIFIGLKKNGKIIGVNPDDVIQKLTSIIKFYCVPEITFSSRILQEGFRMVLEISVLTSIAKPCKLIVDSTKKLIFTRIEGQKVLANKILINVWKYKKQNVVKLIEFSEDELAVLELIKSNPDISLTQIYKKSEISISTIDYIIVRFICSDLITMDLKENGSSMFSLMK